MRTILRSFLCVLFVAVLAGVIPAAAQNDAYRAIWVDTFNSNLNNEADVDLVVANARSANMNAIFAQVRRRGDSWYLIGREAVPDGVPIKPDFDPLAYLILRAHAYGIEVHAYVIVNAIYSKHPTITGLPGDPNHIFNLHGWDRTTNQILAGHENWLTRSLLNGIGGITFNGYRFGSDFWMDPGHPDAEEYTVKVFTDLVRNYDVDGLHLDRIRYPEFSGTGVPSQTKSTGANVGYNETSVARFQQHYGIAPGTTPPSPGDPLWMQWRRDQVSNLVRRIYLNAIAIKPGIKVSASTIVFGGGPGTDWTNAEAYWRVYQDWDAWLREGILDMAAPMNYKREFRTAEVTMFNGWLDWTRDHQYDRAVIMGISGGSSGTPLNSVECMLRQTRRSLLPSAVGNTLPGVIVFSMANSNAQVASDPCAVPPGQNSPLRPFAEFASGLTTSRSVDGKKLYEDVALNPVPVFATPATVPAFSWKTNPQVGHLMGIIKNPDGTLLDTAAIQIARLDDGSTPAKGRTDIVSATDGGGFYGGVDLAPGTYQVTVTPTGQQPHTMQCTTNVVVGQVTQFDFTIDRAAPQTTLTADPLVLWPPNNKMVPVTITGTATDEVSGVDTISFRVRDSYGFVEPQIATIDGAGRQTLDWTASFELEASRLGGDKAGRVYTIEVTLKDRACNVRTYTVQVTVPHDKRN